MSECTHCYHETGVVIGYQPARMEKVCCWCGETIFVAMFPRDHGPFAPRTHPIDPDSLPEEYAKRILGKGRVGK